MTSYWYMPIGLDIGGANLKAAHSDGSSVLQPFALWREPDRLSEMLRGLLRSLPDAGQFAVTMTGELCDCFAGKRAGVAAILDAVEAVAGNRVVHVWSVNGFLHPATARSSYLQVASANWHALATWVARLVDGPGILIDIGSTTADIIPFCDGQAAARGLTDPDRLRSGELVYTGVRRTPICALLGAGVAAELFATTLDAYLLLEQIAENEGDCNTADGQPATCAAAHVRMARMLCADAELFTLENAKTLARQVQSVQLRCLAVAAARVAAAMSPAPETAVLCGSGEFLGRMLIAECTELRTLKAVSLAGRWGVERSAVACAYALVELLSPRLATC